MPHQRQGLCGAIAGGCGVIVFKGKKEYDYAIKEKIRPIFVLCPTCDGVGFVLFESFEFAGFEEPMGLIRAKCEKCGGAGEVILPHKNPEK